MPIRDADFRRAGGRHLPAADGRDDLKSPATAPDVRYLLKDAFAQPELAPVECVVFVDISAPARPDRGIALAEIRVCLSGVAVRMDDPYVRFRLKLSNERLEHARLLLDIPQARASGSLHGSSHRQSGSASPRHSPQNRQLNPPNTVRVNASSLSG